MACNHKTIKFCPFCGEEIKYDQERQRLHDAALKVVRERYKLGGEWKDLSDAILELANVVDETKPEM